MKFGDKLIVLRKKNGLSQEELAEKLGVSRQSVSKWESNNTYPETDKIVQICNLFECSMDDLINDKVTDVEGSLRKNKNNLNEVWDSLLEFITKTINMFSHMKFTSGLRCIIEIAILAFVLWLIGLGICSISSNIIANLFNFLGSKTTSIIRNILNNIFNVLWFVIAVITLVHTFKIRYLNYYEESQEEQKDNKNKNINDKKDLEVSERIIIRDEKDKPFAFLSVLSRIVLWFIKFIVLWIALGSVFAIIGLVTASIVSLSYIPTHTLFVGSTISLISATAIAVLFLLLCIYFIISKKINVKVFVITFIASVVLFGTGIGICTIAFKNIDFITDENSDTISTKKYSIEPKEDLVITAENAPFYKYIIDENIPDNKIELEVGIEKDIDDVGYTMRETYMMHNYHLYSTRIVDPKTFLKIMTKDLSNNKIYVNRLDPDINSITIRANSNNINQLISNAEKLFLIEKKTDGNTITVKEHDLKTTIISECDDEYDARNDSIIAGDDDECICKRKTENTLWGDKIIINCYEEDFD